MARTGSKGDVVAVTKKEVKTRQPREYQVLLLNDDYTPMDFVVSILETIFRKSAAEAVRLMLEVHHQGRAVCGVYSRQIAEAKVVEVRERARAAEHPLEAILTEVPE
jgi:ATP-dependent Clp protease adaptor protein ClpS